MMLDTYKILTVRTKDGFTYKFKLKPYEQIEEILSIIGRTNIDSTDILESYDKKEWF